MRPISQVIETAQQLSASETQTPSRQTLKSTAISKFWRRMQGIYGHKWVSAFGVSDVDGTWAIGLGDLAPEELGIGLRACVMSGEAWPPSLPEFRVLCRPPAPPKRENEAMYRVAPSHQLTHEITAETRQYGRSMCAYLKSTLVARA